MARSWGTTRRFSPSPRSMQCLGCLGPGDQPPRDPIQRLARTSTEAMEAARSIMLLTATALTGAVCGPISQPDPLRRFCLFLHRTSDAPPVTSVVILGFMRLGRLGHTSLGRLSWVFLGLCCSFQPGER